MEIKTLDKPWGSEEIYTQNEPSTVKILKVDPRGILSLQTHKNREEFWKILKGYGFVTLGDKKIEAHAGDSFFIKKGEAHRIEAQEIEIEFLEISYGAFDEEDIVRLEDAYGRV